jgi:hypothetical protein
MSVNKIMQLAEMGMRLLLMGPFYILIGAGALMFAPLGWIAQKCGMEPDDRWK